MTSPLPVLYSFRRCPYAMRARLGIAEAGLQVELREVVLRDKPQALFDASPKGTVPVLVLDDRVLDESIDILLHVLPADHPWRTTESRDLDLIALNDGPFKHHLDRAKYATRYPDEDPAEHWAAAAEALSTFDGALVDGHLSGEGFGLADVCIGPFVRQLANHDRRWFEGLGLPGLVAWLDRFTGSERFAAIMTKVAQWQPGTPGVPFP